jgi:hypothetical protein
VGVVSYQLHKSNKGVINHEKRKVLINEKMKQRRIIVMINKRTSRYQGTRGLMVAWGTTKLVSTVSRGVTWEGGCTWDLNPGRTHGRSSSSTAFQPFTAISSLHISMSYSEQTAFIVRSVYSHLPAAIRRDYLGPPVVTDVFHPYPTIEEVSQAFFWLSQS